MSDPTCPHERGCEVYPLFSISSALQTWKIMYCHSDFSRCKRYKLASEGKPVPLNLLPNGVLLRKPGAGGGGEPR
jgi:hypothetical protein